MSDIFSADGGILYKFMKLIEMRVRWKGEEEKAFCYKLYSLLQASICALFWIKKIFIMIRLQRHQLYGHLFPNAKTIQDRRTRHAGQCWRRKDELISDVLLCTPTYGQAKAGRPARTYIQQLCEDTGCSPEDQPDTMNDWEKWRERVRDIRASGTTWW